jgi:hypothetical protein
MENPMKFISFLHKKQLDFLRDRRIVVWQKADHQAPLRQGPHACRKNPF